MSLTASTPMFQRLPKHKNNHKQLVRVCISRIGIKLMMMMRMKRKEMNKRDNMKKKKTYCKRNK